MTRLPMPLLAATALLWTGVAAQAACEAGKAGHALSPQEVAGVYDCLKDALLEGYRQGDKRWIPADYVETYRSWVPASTFPAASGFHGERFLVTYVNEIGADEYLRFKQTGVVMPAGSLLAQESFAIDDQGRIQPGPLFLMEKVEAGRSPQTDDWFYMAVSPNGSPMVMDVISACSDCHQKSYGHQGGVGYPSPEARVAP